MRLLPAPGGCGILFRRTDLDNFEIPATGRNVAKVSYATSLMRQGVLISTTEHLLSALIGCGVDNVIVELDNLELPILDGSALPYVEAFRDVGLKTQRRRREYLRIRKTVEVREGDKFIGVYPGEGYSVSYKIDFPTPIGRQGFVVDLATGDYGAQIAPARTFGFKEDEAEAAQHGPHPRRVRIERHHPRPAKASSTARCASTTNSSATRCSTSSATWLSPATTSSGHVVAERAGHAMHTALVSRLLKDRSAWELVTLGQAKSKLKDRLKEKVSARPAAALVTA